VYSIRKICEIVKGQFLQQQIEASIEHLLFDSRNVAQAGISLFIALHGAHNDGHKYIGECYEKGLRNFLLDTRIPIEGLQVSNIILVANTAIALQLLAQHHREHFSIPVFGVTGSNGKTIIKEWLYQLLNPEFNIVRSPKSYNSQLGVPVSVWLMNASHNLAIFEAGISRRGEMHTLQKIIQPTLGIITNIGEAHNEGFRDNREKLIEKLKLFSNAKIVIGPKDLLYSIPNEKALSWSETEDATVRILSHEQRDQNTSLRYTFNQHENILIVPFIDEASVENCITCLCVMLQLKYNPQIINERFAQLHAVDMRLQLKYGINGCTIINDSYSADLTSFAIALHFLAQQHKTSKRTVILSDFDESGKKESDLYSAIAKALIEHKIDKLIAIGEKIILHLPSFLPGNALIELYQDPEIFINSLNPFAFQNETILIKGARRFGFERIAQLFETKVHQTILEINLNAIAHNLKQYKALLKPQTKIMAMV
jgi:alanine racemase